MGWLFAGLTQLIQSIGPAIGGLIAAVLPTWAAITTVSFVLRQVRHIGGVEEGPPDLGYGDDEEEEDDEGEDIIDEPDDDDWGPDHKT